MKKYAIWNKQDSIITPVGEVLTAEQWIQRYPVAGVDTITVICAAGEINGAFFGTLGKMVEMYEKRGCDFTACVTDQEKLDVIEAFEDELELQAKLSAEEAKNTVTTDERIAAALEAQVMMSMPDEEL